MSYVTGAQKFSWATYRGTAVTNDPSPRRFAIQFDSKIGPGQIFNGLIMIIGFAWIGSGWMHTNEMNQASVQKEMKTTQDDVKALRLDMTTQNAELKAGMATQFAAAQIHNSEQFRGVRSEITNLPDLRAEVTQVSKRVDASDSRIAAQSARIEQAIQMGIQAQADIANLIRANSNAGRLSK